MSKKAFKAVIPVVCAVFLFSACSTGQSGVSQKSLQMKSAPRQAVHEGNINKISVIPSYNGPKYTTTNRKGTNYNGMGTTIHSRIGSSGLSAEGKSGQLEDMLNKQGIQGIKVLMVGDKVVLGEQRGGASGIDPLQRKLLSPYTGQSGTSNAHSSGSTAVRSVKEKDDYLEQARHRVQSMLGGKAHVLTVTHPDGIAAMERAEAKGNGPKALSSKAHSKDIALILKHAKGSK
ncbi:hypothetical protein [Cohnella sp. WQ 127256]|uniref:hypothetical protein n=1 Tax=Cohnella sp. WQ 127256 TaxID=2938790 RepID=UPI002119188E|nr:hypothetical protein [Cohnella sp. WQ 127256]